MAGTGWGTVFGWIFDRLPNKKESLRKVIENCERQMNEIQKKPYPTDADRNLYVKLSHKLREAEDALKAI